VCHLGILATLPSAQVASALNCPILGPEGQRTFLAKDQQTHPPRFHCEEEEDLNLIKEPTPEVVEYPVQIRFLRIADLGINLPLKKEGPGLLGFALFFKNSFSIFKRRGQGRSNKLLTCTVRIEAPLTTSPTRTAGWIDSKTALWLILSRQRCTCAQNRASPLD
jgi:hypothetical protein